MIQTAAAACWRQKIGLANTKKALRRPLIRHLQHPQARQVIHFQNPRLKPILMMVGILNLTPNEQTGAD